MADLTGLALGKYHLIHRLGRGGMADVYKAFQPGLDRYVAIKVLHEHLAEDEGFINRFKREARAVADLRHAQIVQVFDFDAEGERYYMAMEYIAGGQTLKERLQELARCGERFSVAQALAIGLKLADALDYAHSHGMIHRDIKPANVLLRNDDDPVLGDFGIAHMVGLSGLTASGAMIGTPAYMSPEQGRGERADERSDIYTLGIILYEMLIGKPPYDADTPYGVILKHINDPLVPPHQLIELIPEPVECIVLKCLAKDPSDRYPTSAALRQALQEALAISDEESAISSPIQPASDEEDTSPSATTFVDGDVQPLIKQDLEAISDSTSVEGQVATPSVPLPDVPHTPGSANQKFHLRWAWALGAAGLLVLVSGALLLAIRPGSAEALASRAQRSISAGDVEGAQRELERAYNLSADPWHLEQAAWMAVVDGNIGTAVEYYDRLMADTSEDPRILARRGYLDWRMRNLPMAHELAERALASDPDMPEARYLMGLVLLDEGKPEEALAMFQSIAGMQENNGYAEPFYTVDLGHEIHFDMARAVWALGDSEWALGLVEEAIEHSDWWPHPYILRADIHTARGELQLAREELLHALRIAEDAFPPMIGEIERMLGELGA